MQYPKNSRQLYVVLVHDSVKFGEFCKVFKGAVWRASIPNKAGNLQPVLLLQFNAPS